MGSQLPIPILFLKGKNLCSAFDNMRSLLLFCTAVQGGQSVLEESQAPAHGERMFLAVLPGA
jgi:hypothetical protein